MLKKNKAFILLFLMEALFILLLLIKCFQPMTSMTVAPSAFIDNIKDKDCADYSEDAGLIFSETATGQSEMEAYSYRFPLSSGGYEISVEYDTVGDIAEPEWDDYNNNFKHTVVGYLSLYSASRPTIDMSPIELTTRCENATGRAYLHFGKTTPDTQVRIEFLNNGTLNIRNIYVSQSRSYLLIRLISFLVLFFITDLVLILLFFLYTGRKTSALNTLVTPLFICGISILTSCMFFNNFIYSGYDLDYHLMRIAHIAKELSYGQFPVRIYRDMLDGYGYGAPLFYCDTFLYIPALLYNAFLPLRTCYQIYAILVNLCTACSSYFCFYRLSNNRQIAYISVTAYMLSLPRLFYLYEDASVGQYTAFIFFPIVILGVYRIYTSDHFNTKNCSILSLGLAGMVSCHMLSTEMTVFFLIIFAAANWKNTFKKPVICSIGVSIAESALLSLYYTVPFIFSYMNLPIKVKVAETSYIKERGLYLSNLFGIFYNGESRLSGSVTGQLPLVLGGGVLIGIICIIYTLININQKSNHTTDNDSSLNLSKNLIRILTLILIALFVSTYYFPWNFIRDSLPESMHSLYALLSSVQFPWRYLNIAIPLICTGIAFSLSYLKSFDKTSYRSFSVLIIALSLLTFWNYQTHVLKECAPVYYTGSTINLEEELAGAEYLLGRDDWKTAKYPWNISNERIDVLNLQRERGNISLDIKNKGSSEETLMLPLFDYGNYYAVEESGHSLDKFKNDDNTVGVIIPPYFDGKITVCCREPLFWRMCDLISLSVFLLAMFSLLRKKYKEPISPPPVIICKNSNLLNALTDRYSPRCYNL